MLEVTGDSFAYIGNGERGTGWRTGRMVDCSVFSGMNEYLRAHQVDQST